MSQELPHTGPPAVPDSITPAAAPASGAGRPPSILLVLSGIGLWGMLIYSVFGWLVLLASNDYGSAMLYFTGLQYVGLPVCITSIALLLVYAVYEKPWLDGMRRSFAFGLQVLLAAFAVLWIGLMAYEQYQDQERRAREDQTEAQRAEAAQRMKAALRRDDVAAFSSALAKCSDYACDNSAQRGGWIGRAVRANATHILAVTLKDLTPQMYQSKEIDRVFPRFCKDGTLFYFPQSLAVLVGFRADPAITGQFLPLWGPKERDNAFYGAAMAGSTSLMETLVKQGVDPYAVSGEFEHDSVFVAAARGAAVESFAWLLHAGMQIRTRDEEQAMWRALADWALHSSPDAAAERIGAWMTQVRFDPRDLSRHAMPLEMAVDRRSPVFAQFLLQHGWRATELPSDLQQSLQKLIASPITTTLAQQERRGACAAGDWTVAEGALY
jgi:hypothetical protein